MACLLFAFNTFKMNSSTHSLGDTALLEVEQALENGNTGKAESVAAHHLGRIKSPPARWFYSLAMIYYRYSHYREAAQLFNRAFAHEPDNTLYGIQLVRCFQLLGFYQKSESILLTLMQIEPDNSTILFLLAICADQAGDHARAVCLSDRAIATNPENAEIKFFKASVLLNSGSPALALQVLDNIADGDQSSPIGTALRSAALERAGCYQEALSILPECTSDSQSYAQMLAYGRAVLHCDDGTVQKAYGKLKCWASRNESVISGNQEKSAVAFLLGDLADRCGLYEAAYSYYKDANRFAYPGEWNRSETISFVNSCMGYSPNTISGISGAQKLVFIVGMPRSGSSLLEKLLVVGGGMSGHGESANVSRLVRKITDGVVAEYLGTLGQLDQASVLSLAEQLLLDYGHAGKTAIHVDKMLFNFQFLPLILKLVTDALVIHIVRDYRDVALSCFMKPFSGHHPYKRSISDIVFQYRVQNKIMNRWKQLFPCNIITVCYEELVTSPSMILPKIEDFLGISISHDLDAICKTETNCATSSYAQVRQPLYQTSVSRWRNYEKFMDFEF